MLKDTIKTIFNTVFTTFYFKIFKIIVVICHQY